MQNRHQVRIHFTVQRTGAECDGRELPKLNEAFFPTWFVPKVHSADWRFCHSSTGPSLRLKGFAQG